MRDKPEEQFKLAATLRSKEGGKSHFYHTRGVYGLWPVYAAAAAAAAAASKKYIYITAKNDCSSTASN
jgi:hypothetical protein